MSASIENSLKDISRQLSVIAKELKSQNQPRIINTDEGLICKCPNCRSEYFAELPEGQKIVLDLKRNEE